MRKSFVAFCLMCALTSALTAYASGKEIDSNKPIPMTARRMAMRGSDLVAHDRVAEGLALLKKAIALAPNYIWAHKQYVAARTHNQGQYDEVRAEYERLMAKEPDNPVYPLVIAETARVPNEYVRPLLEKVIQLAPDWAWAHYAKARLYDDEKNQLMAAEFLKCVEQDETASDAYYSLSYVLEKGLGKIDEAISVTEKLSAQPEFRLQGLRQLWRLRLNKAQGSDAAKASLRTELTRLLASSNEVETLSAIRSAYLDLLNDSDEANKVERTIRRIDPAWYPERGQTLFIAASNESGIPRPLLIANRQFSIFNQVERLDELEPKEKVAGLEKLLALKPGTEMKIYIYQLLLRAAEKVKDKSAFVRHGEALHALEPNDTGLLAKLAIALADQKTDLTKALGYAHLAEQSTTELRPVQRPRNTPPEWFTWSFPESRWRDNYKRQRALALDAVGWTLYQMGDYTAAESKLRQSSEIVRGERNLSHLAELLRRLGRTKEAEAIARDANAVWLESLKRQFVTQPSSDFQLEGIGGQTIKLSELKGKVVLLDFWATWCGPCVQEMPHLIELYEKYKERGFEVLAISVDAKSERYKVAPFVAEHKMTFPVLFDEGVGALYKVKAYPTTIFIDRQGNVRYVDSGFNVGQPRALEAVTIELLK